MNNFQGSTDNKNKEIAELKAKVDDLNNQIVENDQEINQVMITLEFNKNEVRDAQRRLEGAFKELNFSLSTFNDLHFDFDGT